MTIRQFSFLFIALMTSCLYMRNPDEPEMLVTNSSDQEVILELSFDTVQLSKLKWTRRDWPTVLNKFYFCKPTRLTKRVGVDTVSLKQFYFIPPSQTLGLSGRWNDTIEYFVYSKMTFYKGKDITTFKDRQAIKNAFVKEWAQYNKNIRRFEIE